MYNLNKLVGGEIMSKHKLKGEYPSRRVWLDGELLDPAPSQTLHNHSPDGFNWGYGGSGPAQLALAIMLKIYGEPNGYQSFKQAFIMDLPQGRSFEIDFELIDEDSENKTIQ